MTESASYWAGYAWLDGEVSERVRLTAEAGRWIRVEAGVAPAAGDVQLPGVLLPGFANTHSHAFHRALRGRTHDGSGTFWTWRERMYALARRLEPDTYYLLARAVFAEMALAGVATVGEFHYLHHRPDGSSYPDPNAFGDALLRAAAEAGIRITLLDTCYLSGGLGPTGYLEPDDVQRRFSDGSVAGWRRRVSLLADSPAARIAAAIHSVRAVPDGQLSELIAGSTGRPLHVHVSEQPAENEAVLAWHGCTPTELLVRHGFSGPLHTAVHATHLSDSDIELYGRSRTNISFCPSTERDLADGIGPASALAAAGAQLTLGSDQNAAVDLLAEAQGLEQDERLASLRRGRFAPAALLDFLSWAGHASLGWPDAGRLAAGQRADLVAVRLDTVRTAGALPAQVVLVAGSSDIDTVLVDGQMLVSGGRHVLGDVAGLLAEAINPLWR